MDVLFTAPALAAFSDTELPQNHFRRKSEFAMNLRHMQQLSPPTPTPPRPVAPFCLPGLHLPAPLTCVLQRL
jgi:hypothetical protein